MGDEGLIRLVGIELRWVSEILSKAGSIIASFLICSLILLNLSSKSGDSLVLGMGFFDS